MTKTIISIFILPLFLYAQIDDIQFEYLSSNDGLSSSIVWSITQDKSGFMWFGTANGLNKYDGYKITAYTHNPFDSSGISDNNITVLYTDRIGYIWIGTFSGGVNRYNPRNDTFVCFQHDPDNPNSISNNCISALHQDNTGNIWIGTLGGGINRLFYTPDSSDLGNIKIMSYSHEMGNTNSIAGNVVTDIFVDSRGIIWIGTSNGLSKMIIDEDERLTIKNYRYDANNYNSISNNYISSICEDASGNVWIGTYDGLNRLNINTERFIRYKRDSENEFSLNDNKIEQIRIDKNNVNDLWIGTFYGGLNKLDITTGRIKHYVDISEPYLHLNNFFVDLYQDAAGMFWMSNWGGGVNKFDLKRNNFKKYLPGFGYGTEETIWGFYENPNSNKNIIWLISFHGGVLKFDRSRMIFKRFLTDPGHPDHKLRDMLYSLYGEFKSDDNSESTLWLGCYAGGLMQFDCEKEKFNYILDDSTNILSKITYRISSIYPDPQQNRIMWFGTNSGGLIKYDKKRKTLKQYNHQPDNSESLSDSFVESILRDRAGTLWIGTRRGGLNRMNEERETFRHFKYDRADTTSISHNEVVSILEGNDSILWIGTGNGLNKFNRNNDIFQHYSEANGLPSNYILGILRDKSDRLWLTTTNGISRFNPKEKGKSAFRNYDVGDGLHGNEFERYAFFKNKNGEIYAGGHQGFTIFQSDSIKDNTNIPPVQVVTFYLFNESVKPADHSVLKYSITHTKEINLHYYQNNISFEFAALDYLNPTKNKYAYKMEGVDRDWVFTDASRRFASYTEMSPGEYIFRIKGSNNDGIWNEEGTSIKVIITPPWWKTSWAYFIYIVLILFSVFGVRRFQLNRIMLKHKLEMEQFETEKLRDVDQMKSRFFANISHEFRTPLTLILGPLHGVLAKIRDSDLINELKLILRNATRLEYLVNQLLDLSRLEAGKMHLQVEQVDIIPLLRKIVLAFTSLAERKKISLKFKTKLESLPTYIDRDKIEKIINNLLSNAFKFTSEKGKIEVRINTNMMRDNKESKFPISQQADPPSGVISNSDFLQITITNTGPAIPPDKIDKIFDRFYQVDDSYTREKEGAGIGLSLVKELVELHHGTITVKSSGTETVFTIQLPLNLAHYAADEMIEKPLPEKKVQPKWIGEELLISDSFLEEHDEKPLQVSLRDKPLILIIEDNQDMRHYIRDNLKDCYYILEADNGKKGLESALKEIPDLIISDIIMPKMDGFQVCETIKNDIHTSHIPVLLLTARAEMKDKLKGLESRADDYISKPFVMEELKIRIKNLIDQRQNLRERFSREALFGIKDIGLTQHDEKFLQQAMALINEHIDDPQFTVHQLSESIGMSRMTFHLKLKALTNQSPHNFIRLLRLKKAAVLLQQKTNSVSEVAYEVGFKNLSHFAKAFKEQFGETPSHFSAHHH